MKLDKHLPKNKIIQFIIPRETIAEDEAFLKEMCNIGIDSDGNVLAKKATTKYIEQLKIRRIKLVAELIDKIDSNADHNNNSYIRPLNEDIA